MQATELQLANSSNSSEPLNCTAFNDEELALYLLQHGGLTLSLASHRLVPLTAAYIVIFVSGFVGNAINCVVIMRHRAMHTTTNLYLLNLSCSDLLTLVLGLPFELWGFYRAYPWRFGEWFCVLRNAAAESTTTVSILTITAFTVERYVAVSRPILARATSSLKRVTRVLVAIWILSVAISGVLATQFGVIYMQDDAGCVIRESALCGVKQENVIQHSFEISTMLFLVPMLAIVVFCLLIAANLRRANQFQTSAVMPRARAGSRHHYSVSERASVASVRRDNGNAAADPLEPRVNFASTSPPKLTINRMLFAVCAAFFTCFAPFHISRVLIYVATTNEFSSKLFEDLSETVYYLAGTLYYLNATVNIVIYNITSKKFRHEYMSELCRCLPHSLHRQSVDFSSSSRTKSITAKDSGKQNN